MRIYFTPCSFQRPHVRRSAGDPDSCQRTYPLWVTNLWRRWERKYAADGELQFTLPDVLKVPPISRHGNVAEIIGKFGGADQLRDAAQELQNLLYAT